MQKIVAYSILLLLGLVCSQLWPLNFHWVESATSFCLCYIMIEVGLEFELDKERLGSYARDYLIAMTAAGFPWIFCAFYFWWVLGTPFDVALLTGRFAAPTSAGVLFTMLAAAGLGASWLFKRARILAVFDDLDTILLMIPLQFMFLAISWRLPVVVFIIAALLVAAYRYLKRLSLSITTPSLLVYSALIVAVIEFLGTRWEIGIEVLLPAFALGCMLVHPHGVKIPTHVFIDHGVKYAFMFLVGLSMPVLVLGEMGWWQAALHVLMLTLLSNLGKMFPFLCYRDEATVRERLALSIAMFPRGEVGAGVLLLASQYGIGGQAVMLGALSLSLNLVLTGFFIWCVLKLTPVTSSVATS